MEPMNYYEERAKFRKLPICEQLSIIEERSKESNTIIGNIYIPSVFLEPSDRKKNSVLADVLGNATLLKDYAVMGMGSENAEYDAARNEQAANEGEIVELDYKIKNAVISEVSSDTSFVHIGSKVTVYDEDLDEEETYEITGTMEANAMENKISNESPVGAALLKRKVGDVVKVNAPDGEYKLVIKNIS